MRRLSIFFIVITVALISGCNNKLWYGSGYEEWEQDSLPRSEEPEYSVYLIGDAGYPESGVPALSLLENKVQGDTNSAVIFLGDNIYHDGMDPEPGSERDKDERKIRFQLDALEDYPGEIYVVPGNHDWDNSGPEGLESILAQEEYVENYLQRGNTFVPDGGCPGPVKVSASENVVMIFLDTQWWLHDEEKPYGGGAECEAVNENDVFIQLQDIIDRNQGRHIMVVAHHPLFSNGNHGGYYNALDHIFPLRLVHEYAYVPLPVIGSLYPLYRMFGGVEQDIANYRYQRLRQVLLRAMQETEITYACGHDHNLQFFEQDDLHHIISGGGCKINPVRKGNDAAFIHKGMGIAKVNYYENGDAWVEYYSAEEDSAEGNLIFRYKMYDKDELFPEAYCTLSREDYSDSTVMVAAGDYGRSSSHEFLLGEHYREAWTTPVEVPVLDLATEEGGLIPYGIGGGKQSLNLKVKNIEGHEYVARSVDKDPGRGAVPQGFENTVVEDMMQDQISAQHPYGALVAAELEKSAGLLHLDPKLVWIPADSCLGPYFDEFSNKLVFFQEDLDEGYPDSPNLNYSENIVGTDKLIEELEEDNDNSIREQEFAKSRLLDMLMGDWDRHQGQYRWAEFEKEGKGEYFRPVPEDRDQVFFRFDGLLPFLVSRAWAFRELQPFTPEFGDLKGLNTNAQHLDRRLLTEVTREEWVRLAQELQDSLTDGVIEEAVAALPDSVEDLDDEVLINTLISRRGQLIGVASEYYGILAEYVDVYGSDKHENFVVERLNDRETKVTVYKTKKEKQGTEKVLYERTFYEDETDEVRLYGLAGRDNFYVRGEVDDGIKVRIIGGPDEDSIVDRSSVSGWGNKTVVYDTEDENYFEPSGETNMQTSLDPSVNDPDQDVFMYDHFGPKLSIDFNRDDGLFIGAGFVSRNYGFRNNPYGSRHDFLASVALATRSVMIEHESEWKTTGSIDYGIRNLIYAPVFVMNYFGYGNTSEWDGRNIDYNRVRLNRVHIFPYLEWAPTDFFNFGVGPQYQYYKLVERPNTFITDEVAERNPDIFDSDHLLGLNGYLQVGVVDRPVNTTRGLVLEAHGEHNRRTNEFGSGYTRGGASLRFYITPNLPWQLTFAGRVGAASNWGDYHFYQANALGGTENLRGYRKTRFVGDYMFYQNAEVRSALFDFNAYLFPATVGAHVFFDNGRVWDRDDPDGSFHQGFGGGIWVSVLNRVLVTGALSFSEDPDSPLFNVRTGFLF